MSDIFISYKREEQATARKLADALEEEGWSVWWDPMLRAGERFNDVIEKALKESKCVVVMWSKRSAESLYVRDEAMYALNRNRVVPVMIEELELPFRFEGLHTPNLIGWDGLNDSPEFRRLVEDIKAIVDSPVTEGQKGQPPDRKRDALKPESSLQPGTTFRDKLKDGSQGPEMVVIPAGEFEMGDLKGDGDQNEQPVHTVRIIKPFAIGRHVVTFEEFDRFAKPTGRKLPADSGWGRGRQPVINVSWDDAAAHAEWLSQQTAKRYRLPSEAEWEYAARGGTKTAYWWGNQMRNDMAKSGGGTSPVGSFPPNPFGLYDTAGNVWEWVQDCWHKSYNGAPTDGSVWQAWGERTGLALLLGDSHVMRGGS
jgi:formylglycine-generating enzyme required for sulfatase activity